MIKPEELKIGNYIKDGNDIEQVTLRHLSMLVNKEAEFDPIPLTEEWLLRLGFTLNKYQKQDLFYYYLEVLSHGKISYYPNIKTIELGTTSGYNFGKTEIKYVHQLQNLYRSLTGEELTLKE